MHGNTLFIILLIKNNLIGKSASAIFDILELDVVEYLPQFYEPAFQGYASATGIGLFFNNENAVLGKNGIEQKRLHLEITFNSGIPVTGIFKLAKKNKKLWTSDEKEFYGKNIIKDIVLYEAH